MCRLFRLPNDLFLTVYFEDTHVSSAFVLFKEGETLNNTLNANTLTVRTRSRSSHVQKFTIYNFYFLIFYFYLELTILYRQNGQKRRGQGAGWYLATSHAHNGCLAYCCTVEKINNTAEKSKHVHYFIVLRKY